MADDQHRAGRGADAGDQAGTIRKEGRSPAGDLIEMADLKERVRKLESIASCIDL